MHLAPKIKGAKIKWCTNWKLIISDSKEIYICEGIEDSLSFMHVGRNSISLNSISNINLFLNKLDHWREVEKFKFIIATDNDKSGLECSYELKKYFLKHNIMYDIYCNHIRANCNDINELWIKKCCNIH